MSTKKSYEELMSLSTFEERLAYLKTYNSVGRDSFGFSRYLNQRFYYSKEWRQLRNSIILRDSARDLACEGYDIIDSKSVIIHHINPITLEDLEHGDSDIMLNPSNLITTTQWTHRLIHYGTDEPSLFTLERKPNDTCPWRK